MFVEETNPTFKHSNHGEHLERNTPSQSSCVCNSWANFLNVASEKDY